MPRHVRIHWKIQEASLLIADGNLSLGSWLKESGKSQDETRQLCYLIAPSFARCAKLAKICRALASGQLLGWREDSRLLPRSED